MTRVLLYFIPEADRGYLSFHPDGKLFLFIAAITLAAAFLFGLVPALRASQADLAPVLRGAARSLTSRRRFSELLLVGQVAACVVLVAGAIMFVRTLWKLNTGNVGFDRKNVVYANPNQSEFVRAGYSRDRIAAAMDEVVGTIGRSPHVARVSMGLPPILVGGTLSGFALVPGYRYADGEENAVYFGSVAPGYFETLSIPLIAGRDFEERDRLPSAPRVMIVNENFVRHYFQGRSFLGQTVTITNTLDASAPRQIIGVVKDSKRDSIRESQKDLVYFPIRSGGWDVIVARARPGVDPSICEAELRSAFASIVPKVPAETGRLEMVVKNSTGRERLVAQLSAAFGGMGILLAAIGLYGAMSHAVRSQTREIGIRLALGAAPRAIRGMVLRKTLFIAVIGTVIGLPVSMVATRGVQALLFGVSPNDPLTFSCSTVLLIGVALFAGWWPADYAARLNPTDALRHE
jgi:predicted permease